MARKRITDLTEATTAQDNDLFLLGLDGGAGSRKLKFSNLFNRIIGTYFPGTELRIQDFANEINTLTSLVTQVQNSLAGKQDAQSGKGLSTNDFTTAYRTKLEGIEPGAEVNPEVATTSSNGLMSSTDKAKCNAIGSTSTTTYNATASAMGLMSKTDKSKLDGIATGATKNTFSAFTGKPTGNLSPDFGGTVTIQQISQSTTGQVSGTDRTITFPSALANSSRNGLLSSTLWSKLSGMNQNNFYRLRVNGGAAITPTSENNILNFAAGNNMTISGVQDAGTTTLTFSASDAWDVADLGSFAGNSSKSINVSTYKLFLIFVKVHSSSGSGDNDCYMQFAVPSAFFGSSAYSLVNYYGAGNSGYVRITFSAKSGNNVTVSATAIYEGTTDIKSSTTIWVYGVA